MGALIYKYITGIGHNQAANEPGKTHAYGLLLLLLLVVVLFLA